MALITRTSGASVPASEAPFPDSVNLPGIPTVSWADDYRQRSNPELFTDLLRQAVPALDSAQWRVLETADGFALIGAPA